MCVGGVLAMGDETTRGSIYEGNFVCYVNVRKREREERIIRLVLNRDGGGLVGTEISILKVYYLCYFLYQFEKHSCFKYK